MPDIETNQAASLGTDFSDYVIMVRYDTDWTGLHSVVTWTGLLAWTGLVW